VSNRLDSKIRLPFIADPELARYTAYSYAQARARIEQALAIGESMASLFTGIADIIDDVDHATRLALTAQRLAALSDRDLARLGLERGDIPAAVWKLEPPATPAN
jgi:uncharacterized protein YjiS (DUF1127 family)